jgi:uncharacterized protein (DUF2345 family)
MRAFFRKDGFSRCPIVKDEKTGKPIVGLEYRIQLPDGSYVYGKTNKKGETQVVHCSSPDDLTLEIVRY